MAREAQGCSWPSGVGGGSGGVGAVGEGFGVHQSLPAQCCRVSPGPGRGGHSPEPGCAHEGSFGEDDVLRGAVPRDWLGLVASPRGSQPGLVASPGGSQPGHCVSKRFSSSSSSPLLPRSPPEQGIPLALLAAVALVHFLRFGGLWAGGRRPLASLELPPFMLAGGRRSSRHVSREGAALPVWQRFHGDRPFLPAAVPPPPERLSAFAEGQVGNGLGRALAPSRAGPRRCLCVELIPREHPWGARRDHSAL